MTNFIQVQCPNCHIKIKIDKDKKYHDCPDCKFEFKLEDLEQPLNTASAATNKNSRSESIFGKFLREKSLPDRTAQ